MGITRIMRNAIQANWTLVDDFKFIFSNRTRPLSSAGNGLSVEDILDISVMNIDLPQLASDAETVMQAGEWRIYNAKFQPFTFSITFRDFGGLDLRNYFSAVWMDAQRGYYDEVKSVVKISVADTIVFESEDCLITSVSQVQLSNDNTQIAEFTVEFTSPYYSNTQIKDFGSYSYSNTYGAGIYALENINNIQDLTGNSSILSSIQNIVGKISNHF